MKKIVVYGISFYSLLLNPLSHAAAADLRDSVVKVYTTTNRMDYYDPWQAKGSQSLIGSGCVISGNRILTNAHVVSDQTPTIAVATNGCPPWIFVNAGGLGYYRTAYSPAALRAMAPLLQGTLTAAEQLSLVEDEWALVRAGRHTVTDYLTIVAELSRSP